MLVLIWLRVYKQYLQIVHECLCVQVYISFVCMMNVRFVSLDKVNIFNFVFLVIINFGHP